jgi:hypothetical protein
MKTCNRNHHWNPDTNRQCPECQAIVRRKRYTTHGKQDYLKSREWIANNKERFKRKVKQWVADRPSHACYRAMLNRCFSPRNDHYAQYGGRGITVCNRWIGVDGYKNFITDMRERPTMKHTIERLDVNGHYTPKNCKWATRKEQGINKRTTVKVTIAGRTQAVSQWAEELGLTRTSFLFRLRKGWPEERLLLPNLQPDQTEKRRRTRLSRGT